jgi:hypothetical protein
MCCRLGPDSVVDSFLDPQGFAFILVGWIWIWLRFWIADPDPDPGRQKFAIKLEFELCEKVMFLSAGCSLLRDEGISYSLDVLHGGLKITNLQFLIKTNMFFSAVKC